MTLTTVNPQMLDNGPAFSAYKNTGADQTVTANTWTKVNYPTEDWDTANCYDATLSRFTPNVSGYYQVSAAVWNTSESLQLRIYKNGASWKSVGTSKSSTSSVNFTQGSAIVYCNGSTDYVEMYANTTATTIYVAQEYVWFQAALVRAA